MMYRVAEFNRGTQKVWRWAGIVSVGLFFFATAPEGRAEDRGLKKPDDIPHVNHVVKPGETLSMLAKQYYGDPYQWPRIHECNTFVDPDHLKVGETICIPNPTQGLSPSQKEKKGFFDWFNVGDSGKKAVEPKAAAKEKNTPKNKQPQSNPPNDGANTGGSSWKAMIMDILNTQCFGRPLSQILLIIGGWFIIHMMIQGAFTWFAAHMAFVKDVSVKKAWRATVQSETLAALFIVIVGVAGLAIIYVATAPPGKPVLSELLMIAEEYLSTPTGMAIGGLVMVGLYVFLGIRFIPQNFGTSGGQGFTIVFLSVLLPHIIFLYLVGYRLGYLG